MRDGIIILTSVTLPSILIVLGLYFDLPIAYIPQDSSSFEFILYNILFALIEVLIFLLIFIKMLNSIDYTLLVELKKYKQ